MMKLKKSLAKLKKQKTANREKLVYRASEYTYNFKNFRTIRKFGRDIYEGKITQKETNEDQSNLLNEIKNFRDKTRLQNDKKKQEKEIVLKNLYNFSEAKEIFLDGFDSKIFSIKSKGSGLLNTDHSKLKILTLKQMPQRLPIALAEAKAGNS